MKFITFLIGLSVLLFSTTLFANNSYVAQASVLGGKQEFTKSINKLFKVGSDGEVKLENSYGDIDYNVWDKDQVKISVTIEVNASNEDKANEIFDRIDIDFTASSSLVEAITSIQNSKSSWNWGPSKTSFEINYEVFAPADFDLELKNKYGDARVASLDADANFEVKYGDLKAGNVSGKTKFLVSYGSGKLGNLQDFDAEIRYSEVVVGSGSNGRVDSKYSETNIKRLNRLTLDSQYDEFFIGSVKELINVGRYDDFQIDSAWSVSLQTRYTDVKIGYLAEGATMQMKYGGAHIKSTSRSLSDIALDGSYADFTVRLDPEIAYELKADGTHASIDLPNSMKIVRKETSGSSSSYQGQSGSGRKANLIFLANYGSISVR